MSHLQAYWLAALAFVSLCLPGGPLNRLTIFFLRYCRAALLVAANPSIRALAAQLEAEKREHRVARLEIAVVENERDYWRGCTDAWAAEATARTDELGASRAALKEQDCVAIRTAIHERDDALRFGDLLLGAMERVKAERESLRKERDAQEGIIRLGELERLEALEARDEDRKQFARDRDILCRERDEARRKLGALGADGQGTLEKSGELAALPAGTRVRVGRCAEHADAPCEHDFPDVYVVTGREILDQTGARLVPVWGGNTFWRCCIVVAEPRPRCVGGKIHHYIAVPSTGGFVCFSCGLVPDAKPCETGFHSFDGSPVREVAPLGPPHGLPDDVCRRCSFGRSELPAWRERHPAP